MSAFRAVGHIKRAFAQHRTRMGAIRPSERHACLFAIPVAVSGSRSGLYRGLSLHRSLHERAVALVSRSQVSHHRCWHLISFNWRGVAHRTEITPPGRSMFIQSNVPTVGLATPSSRHPDWVREEFINPPRRWSYPLAWEGHGHCRARSTRTNPPEVSYDNSFMEAADRKALGSTTGLSWTLVMRSPREL